MPNDQTAYEKELRAELAVMRRIVVVLGRLPVSTQERIVRYLVDRYETAKGSTTP